MGCYIMAAIMLCNAAGCGGTNNPREQGTNTPGSAIETADLQQQKILDDEVKEELGVGELHGEGANPFRKQTEKAKILYVKDFGAKGDGINNYERHNNSGRKYNNFSKTDYGLMSCTELQ